MQLLYKVEIIKKKKQNPKKYKLLLIHSIYYAWWKSTVTNLYWVWQMEGSETDLNSNVHRDKHESVGCLGTTCRKKIKFDLLDIQSVRFLRNMQANTSIRQLHT